MWSRYIVKAITVPLEKWENAYFPLTTYIHGSDNSQHHTMAMKKMTYNLTVNLSMKIVWEREIFKTF